MWAEGKKKKKNSKYRIMNIESSSGGQVSKEGILNDLNETPKGGKYE
jgi:hypothetical protein